MSHLSSQPHDVLNAKLERIVPEIAASQYGKYPMEGTRWLSLTELSPEGSPTFIKGPDTGPKKDYAHGIASYGEAYYHLLTKPAYTVLYNRAKADAPFSPCPCFQSGPARQEMKDYDNVLEILLLRTRASIANDAQAAKDVLLEARHNNLDQYM
jgi:hypothetical protein